MPRAERQFAVCLGDQRVGTLCARDDYTWFVLDSAYHDLQQRPVLGLRFEEDLHARHSANMRLPPWFSNLLPEGQLREWIAQGRGVSADREMELLAEVGGDLPGAVRIHATDERGGAEPVREVPARRGSSGGERRWRFSLAGVQLKFSMLRTGDRFVAPASGTGGEWIVKLPDHSFPDVPLNELAMMELARSAGIDVPETRLVHRDELDDVPARLWPESELYAYAVKRFDRAEGGRRVHMEDLAQVRGWYPGRKYDGTYETLANYVYRGSDEASLRELVRRLAFCVLIRNGDAHLKNWSLLYRDPRVPTLSPVYDLVCTEPYRDDGPEALALKLGGSKGFERIGLSSFAALQHKLRVGGRGFDDEAAAVVDRVAETWPEVRERLRDSELLPRIDSIVAESVRRMRD